MTSSESPELYVAIGRIEEGMRFMRESQERMEKKIDIQDSRLNQVELDVKELKTQRDTKSNKITIAVSIAAVIIAALSLLRP